MLVIILSDLHLGQGRFFSSGEVNILEDFYEDDRFSEFCDYYCSAKYFLEHVHLVLNGDILNLIQVDTLGVFTHMIDEEVTIGAINKIADGHPSFFNALKHFLSTPNKKLTYVIGNHDAGMAFYGAQERMRELVGEGLEFCTTFKQMGLHIEHGHRFEVINTVPAHKYYLNGPDGRKILNLPWGSLFCLYMLPLLKKDRPHLDKVRPIGAYLRWCFFNDTSYFFRLLIKVIKYFIETNKDDYTRQNRNFQTSLHVLKQITIYPRYSRKAKQILKTDPSLHTVIMGHTHVQEWRKFSNGRYYFNTGTWNPIPSVDAGLHEASSKLTYCLLDIDENKCRLRSGALHLWQGKWRPFREETSTSPLI